VDRITRKALKKDTFALEVGHTVDFLEHHRKQFIRYGIAAVALLLIVAGLFYYNRRQHAARQDALRAAMDAMATPVGPSPAPGIMTFLSPEEKRVAVSKALTDLVSRYSGSTEGAIAEYYLGTMALSQGNQDEAIKRLSETANSGSQEPASVARLALAGLYATQGKTADAEKLLRSLIDRPTILVPKEEATIALARVIAPSKPDEARKLLEPLRSAPGAAGRAAITAYGQLFASK
jgi:predicted negative regulator of RcsB-dependent stress response